MKKQNKSKYALEFLSIFVAVIAAFALNNWNENRKENNAEEKILLEIKNGLEKDLKDFKINIQGHKNGLIACQFWRNIIQGKPEKQDSLYIKYIRLTRDFTSLQNTSGYETLKSRGLELLENDLIRSDLISLYEYDYSNLRKLEEEYEETQFQKNYFTAINEKIAPNFVYDENGYISKIETPIKLSKEDKRILMSYLMKIEINRKFVLNIYRGTEKRVNELKTKIDIELKKR